MFTRETTQEFQNFRKFRFIGFNLAKVHILRKLHYLRAEKEDISKPHS